MKIQKYQRGGGLLRLGSGLLDTAEFVPVVGDILGMGRSLLRRDWVGMGLSAAGLIPGVGNAATATKAARKGIKAVARGADVARAANKTADAARVVKPNSIGWFKPQPKTGNIVDDLGDVKDAVFVTRTSPNLPARTGEMIVRNPNLPVPSKTGGLATTVHYPDLPKGGPSKWNDWRKYLEQNGWKYGAGAAALLGLGLLNRNNDEVPSEVVPVTDGGEIVSPVVPTQPVVPAPVPVPVQPVQPATPVYVPVEPAPNTENAPVETVKPENKTEQSSDKPSSQISNSPIVSETAQPEVAVISNRLAKRLDKYNRVNRYGNFIKDRQEEHPGSRYLDRMERRADRKEERAYNRLSKTAARQGVNFGTNQDEFAYIKPATPTYVGPYNK